MVTANCQHGAREESLLAETSVVTNMLHHQFILLLNCRTVSFQHRLSTHSSII